MGGTVFKCAWVFAGLSGWLDRKEEFVTVAGAFCQGFRLAHGFCDACQHFFGLFSVGFVLGHACGELFDVGCQGGNSVFEFLTDCFVFSGVRGFEFRLDANDVVCQEPGRCVAELGLHRSCACGGFGLTG